MAVPGSGFAAAAPRAAQQQSATTAVSSRPAALEPLEALLLRYISYILLVL
jgi:hypothetical protein